MLLRDLAVSKDQSRSKLTTHPKSQTGAAWAEGGCGGAAGGLEGRMRGSRSR